MITIFRSLAVIRSTDAVAKRRFLVSNASAEATGILVSMLSLDHSSTGREPPPGWIA
jgi:hypothetical protein